MGKRKEITQADVAKTLGTGQAYVSLFIAGKKNCGIKTAQKLTIHFGKTVEWWMRSSAFERQRQTGLTSRTGEP